ncbi:MAG: DsrE family protein [Rhodocyclaceae bacterium]|nr:DsrE family protein [Rhodocyclaceae bacterium]
MKRALFAAAALFLASPVPAQHAGHGGMMPGAAMQSGMQGAMAGGPAIDIPVNLKEAKVVFRIDRVAPGGDNGFAVQQIAMLAEKFRLTGTEAKIVAVFNGAGGFMLLNDKAYDEARKTRTGNPYKAGIGKLLAMGVQVEECGMTMMRDGWTNAQLLPGVKVNAGANLRMIDLAQQGYVAINP